MTTAILDEPFSSGASDGDVGVQPRGDKLGLIGSTQENFCSSSGDLPLPLRSSSLIATRIVALTQKDVDHKISLACLLVVYHFFLC